MSSRTRIVTWLRVILPLAALAILSTLFLLSRRPDPEGAIPYATVDAEARARDPHITAPSYAGVTADGATLALTADRATPGQGGGVAAAEGLRLDWKGVDGLELVLTAPTATMQQGTILLDGGVRLAASTGWRIEAPRIEAATDRSRIAATGGVSAAAPFGDVTAGAVELRRQQDHALLDFTGGVRLIYRP